MRRLPSSSQIFLLRVSGNYARGRQLSNLKIVSLLPSATELAAELGLQEYLCAISHECDTPTSILHLPHATGSIIPHGLSQSEINRRVAEAVKAGESLYTVNGELIDELSPELILTQGLCDICAVTPEVIEASLRGVKCQLPVNTKVLSFTGESLSGIRDDFFKLATAVGRMDHAQSIWQAHKNRWDSITNNQKSMRVLLLEWVDPPYSPGHWVPEQIEAAGFTSALGRPGDHSRPLSTDDIVAAKADAIGVICCGYGLDDNIRFAREIANGVLHQIGFTGQLAAFNANRCFSRPTFSVVDGAAALHETFGLGRDVYGLSKRIPV